MASAALTAWLSSRDSSQRRVPGRRTAALGGSNSQPSRKSITQGRWVTLCKRSAIRCAVSGGEVLKMSVGMVASRQEPAQPDGARQPADFGIGDHHSVPQTSRPALIGKGGYLMLGSPWHILRFSPSQRTEKIADDIACSVDVLIPIGRQAAVAIGRQHERFENQTQARCCTILMNGSLPADWMGEYQ